MSVERDIETIRRIVEQRSGLGSGSQPTSRTGVELPLVQASPMIQDVNLVGKGPSWASVMQQDVHHYTQGEILISVESAQPRGSGIWAYAAEVQVLGQIQGGLDLLASVVVNSGTGPARVLLPIGSTFNTITLQARQLVNGLPSALNLNSTSGTSDMTGARLRLAARMRVYR